MHTSWKHLLWRLINVTHPLWQWFHKIYTHAAATDLVMWKGEFPVFAVVVNALVETPSLYEFSFKSIYWTHTFAILHCVCISWRYICVSTAFPHSYHPLWIFFIVFSISHLIHACTEITFNRGGVGGYSQITLTFLGFWLLVLSSWCSAEATDQWKQIRTVDEQRAETSFLYAGPNGRYTTQVCSCISFLLIWS